MSDIDSAALSEAGAALVRAARALLGEEVGVMFRQHINADLTELRFEFVFTKAQEAE